MGNYFQNSQPIIDHLSYLGLDFDIKKLEAQLLREQQSRVVLFCSNQQDEKFIFKILTKDDSKYLERFKRELNTLRYIEKESELSARILLKEGALPSSWMLLKYAEGNDTGNTFVFDPKYTNTDFIDQLVKSLVHIQEMTPFAMNPDCPKEIGQLISSLFAEFQEEHPLYQYKNHLGELFENSHDYLNNLDNYSFSHGDLLPHNIIDNQGQLYLIDWEVCGHRPKTFDVAYLYQRLLIYPEQREYYKQRVFETVLSEGDRASFDRWTLLLLAKDISTFDKMLNHGLILKHKHEEALTFAKDQYENYKKIFAELITKN